MQDADRPRVLLLFAESLSAPECAWSLGQDGFEIVAVTRAGKHPPLRKSRLVQVVEVPPPEAGYDRTLLALEALVSEGVDVVLPLDDHAVWLCDQLRTRSGVEVAGPTGVHARLALDKGEQLVAAEAAGMHVPATCFFDRADDAREFRQFPSIVKPRLAIDPSHGRLRRASGAVCANEGELERALANLSDAGPLLIQPFIAGIGEGLFGLATEDGVCAWSAHRRLRMMNPAGSGSSACVPIDVDSQVTHTAEAFLKQVGWRGIFMIEFLRDEAGRPWFMEINGRAWGSMALARRMGLEYPAWGVRQAIDGSFRPPTSSPAENITCRHLGRELVHLLMVLRGPKSAALVEWPSRWRTLLDVLRLRKGDRWYNLKSGEIPLFLSDTFQTVFEQVKPGRRRKT